jgi:meiotic recombination protein REC8
MKGKGKGKATASYTLPPNSEFLRATACTLPENHDFLLANSFDASFGGSGTVKFSSSQTGGFGFDDTFDGLDIGEGVGDDIVRELGEGWGASPIEENAAE